MKQFRLWNEYKCAQKRVLAPFEVLHTDIFLVRDAHDNLVEDESVFRHT